ncbi:MAG: Asp-tRNA(Asn)/Glu-tRNA(Gln) amidotransferase subunit GatC [Bdellovibrionota bacterium]
MSNSTDNANTKVDAKTIEQIAKLARLEVSETQAKQYSQQLSQILNYFEQISKVNTEGVEPLVTPSEIESFWREDEVKKDYTAEEMTANAPSRAGNLFKVPPVV